MNGVALAATRKHQYGASYERSYVTFKAPNPSGEASPTDGMQQTPLEPFAAAHFRLTAHATPTSSKSAQISTPIIRGRPIYIELKIAQRVASPARSSSLIPSTDWPRGNGGTLQTPVCTSSRYGLCGGLCKIEHAPTRELNRAVRQ
jgi:hypothetical protein